jgi:plasmid stability protein
MSITLHLSPETERLLEDRAALSGQSVEAFIQSLIECEIAGRNGGPALTESAADPLREQLLEELRREIAIGVDQADAGNVAPLDAQATLARIRKRRAEAGKNP